MAKTDKEKFIQDILGYVEIYALKYNVQVYSPILAQAILESACGTSELAVNAKNYFGLKYRKNRCPTSNGTYNKIGSEQNSDGSYVSSNMKWFTFPSMEACVIGYFDFTNISNYNNLKGITDPELYCKNLKIDQYATSLDYDTKLMNTIKAYDLTRFDPKPQTSEKLYRVQVGAYKVKKNAENMLAKLKAAGFNGFIVEVETETK